MILLRVGAGVYVRRASTAVVQQFIAADTAALLGLLMACHEDVWVRWDHDCEAREGFGSKACPGVASANEDDTTSPRSREASGCKAFG